MGDSRYKLETVARACEILRQFDKTPQPLSLRDIVRRTGFEQTIAFRLLRTLEEEGVLRRTDRQRYAANFQLLSAKRYRIGYASQTSDSFSMAVTQGIRWAAEHHRLDLIEAENRYSPSAAVRNAQKLAAQGVDLAVEFQTYERIGAKIASIFAKAGIPVIAVEIPEPGAHFFGIDNYSVGRVAGNALVKAAQRSWRGAIDELLLLDLEIAGSLLHLRISGAESIVRASLAPEYRVHHIDSQGEMDRAFYFVRRHLALSRSRKTLIFGVNDFAVLGALRAFAEAGRAECCLGLGVGAIPEARRELRSANSRLIGSIATFPERYGDAIVQMALDLIQGRSVPPAVYAPIQLITAQNIERYYPRKIYADADNTA